MSSYSLNDTELTFQLDPNSWRYGPVLAIRFFFDFDHYFSGFVQALENDEMRVTDPRFGFSDKVLLHHPDWPTCLGARYFDFHRDDRREPSIIVYPKQYRAVCGTLRGTPNPVEPLLRPLVALASRLRSVTGASYALVFMEDYFPLKPFDTNDAPGVFLSERFSRGFARR